MTENRTDALLSDLPDADVPPRGAPGCTCGTPPFAPPEPSADCPFHGVDPHEWCGFGCDLGDEQCNRDASDEEQGA